MRGSSSLPSVYPVKVIYPHAANTTLITTASETDTCVTRDQFFNVGSSRDPYIKKLLWLQMNAETDMTVKANVWIQACKISLQSVYSKVGETQHSLKPLILNTNINPAMSGKDKWLELSLNYLIWWRFIFILRLFHLHYPKMPCCFPPSTPPFHLYFLFLLFFCLRTQ